VVPKVKMHGTQYVDLELETVWMRCCCASFLVHFF